LLHVEDAASFVYFAAVVIQNTYIYISKLLYIYAVLNTADCDCR